MVSKNRKPAVFLDRDGTIIHDKHYLKDPENIELFDFTIKALRKLRENGFMLFIITNQSGVARGAMSEEDVRKVNDRLLQILSKNKIDIADISYCPYYKDGKIDEYAKESNCRKPRTGMIDKAMDKFDIDKNYSYVIGDKITDAELGLNAGMTPIMVKTGHGERELRDYSDDIDFTVRENLLEAVNYIIEKRGIDET
jgi:D,D-heptose 1,7-bisphosphate phosphatase